jgi:hypothetical protein
MNCGEQWEPAAFVIEVCNGGSYSSTAIQMKKEICASIRKRMLSSVQSREISLIPQEQEAAKQRILSAEYTTHYQFVKHVFENEFLTMELLSMKKSPSTEVEISSMIQSPEVKLFSEKFGVFDKLLRKESATWSGDDKSCLLLEGGVAPISKALSILRTRLSVISGITRDFNVAISQRNHFNSSATDPKTEEETVKTVRYECKCPKDGCNGWMVQKSKSYKVVIENETGGEFEETRSSHILECGICSTTRCSTCRNNHALGEACNEDDVKSIVEIKSKSKPCPKCSVPIMHSSGCADMFCPQCNTCFHYRTGKIDERGNTNPLYAIWRSKQNGTSDITNFAYVPEEKLSRFLDIIHSGNRIASTTIRTGAVVIGWCSQTMLVILASVASNFMALNYINREIFPSNMQEIETMLRRNRCDVIVNKKSVTELVEISMGLDSTIIFMEIIRKLTIELLDQTMDEISKCLGTLSELSVNGNADSTNDIAFQITDTTFKTLIEMSHRKSVEATTTLSVFEELGFSTAYNGSLRYRPGRSRSAAQITNVIGNSTSLKKMTTGLTLYDIFNNLKNDISSSRTNPYYRARLFFLSRRLPPFIINDSVVISAIKGERSASTRSSIETSHVDDLFLRQIRTSLMNGRVPSDAFFSSIQPKEPEPVVKTAEKKKAKNPS